VREIIYLIIVAILIIVISIMLSIFGLVDAHAFRVLRPVTLSLPLDEDQINQLNDYNESIWNLQQGEFNFDIETTSKTGADNGDMWIVTPDLEFQAGDATYLLAPAIYGHFYTNTQTEVTISNNNPTEVAAGMTTGLVRGVTFGGSHFLGIVTAGEYLVNWGMSAAMAAAGGGIEFEIGIMIDGTNQNECQAHRTLANTTDTGNAASNCILDLAAGEEVSLSVTNETNTTNIDVEHANLSITRLGP